MAFTSLLIDDASASLLRRRTFRAFFATLCIVWHVAMIVLAAHAQKLPFNRAPGAPPAFVNIKSYGLGPFPREPRNWTRLAVSRFDSQHYESFALRGFRGCPDEKATPENLDAFMGCNVAWLPGYGLLGGAVMHAVPVGADYVLMAISVVSLWLLVWLWSSPVIVRRFGARETFAGIVALNVFPSAFHLVAVYAEGITLVCVFATFYAIVRGRWLPAALLVGLSTAFRPTALCFSLAFGVAALVCSYRLRKEHQARWWWPALTTPLAAWGMMATSTYYDVRFGDPLLFNHARAFFGDRPDVTRLFTAALYIEGFATREYDLVLLVALAILVALGAARALRRCGPEERIYLALGSGLATAMALVNATDRWGLNRYMLIAVFAFLATGAIARRAPLVYALWLLLCGALYWHVSLCNFIAHGNMKMCPMLGPRDGMELPIDG